MECGRGLKKTHSTWSSGLRGGNGLAYLCEASVEFLGIGGSIKVFVQWASKPTSASERIWWIDTTGLLFGGATWLGRATTEARDCVVNTMNKLARN